MNTLHTIKDDINFINPNIEGKNKIICRTDAYSIWIKIAKKKIKFGYSLYKLILIIYTFSLGQIKNIINEY